MHEMRRLMILLEGRDAPLFHELSVVKARKVFVQDRMLARWKHEVPGLGTLMGNSFTRNKRYTQEGFARITVDQRQLAQRHRIIPLDGDLAFHGDDMRSRQVSYQRARGTTLDEEFVIGDIQAIHRYIRAIEVVGVVEGSYEETVELIEVVQNYAEKFGIPFSISQEVQDDLATAQEDE